MTVDKQELRSVLAEVLDRDIGEIGDRTHFIDELDVDSLMSLEVMVRLEKRYSIRMQETDLSSLTCLERVHELLVERVGVSE